MSWDPTMFALAFASTAALAGAIWWGAADAEADRAVQEAAMLADLRAEMAAKFGRSKPADCEEKVREVAPLMRAAMQANQSKYTPSRAAAAALALAEDQPIAPWWRRVLAFLLDNFVNNGAAFAGQWAVLLARPDWEDKVNATIPSVIWAFIVSVGLETLMLMKFNGKTLGKWATGTQVRRQDGKALDWATALKLASTRALCMPFAALPDTIPLIFSADCRENGQLVHNWISGTIVIDESRIIADRELDEDDD